MGGSLVHGFQTQNSHTCLRILINNLLIIELVVSLTYQKKELN